MAAVWFIVWYIFAFSAYPHFSTISYLGTMSATIVPFMVAMIGAAFFLWRAAEEMSNTPVLMVSSVLVKAFSICVLLISFIPFTINKTFFIIHMIFAAGLVIFGIGASFVLAVKIRNILGALIFVAQISAVAFMAYSFGMRDSDPLWKIQIVYQLVMIAGMFTLLFMASGKMKSRIPRVRQR